MADAHSLHLAEGGFVIREPARHDHRVAWSDLRGLAVTPRDSSPISLRWTLYRRWWQPRVSVSSEWEGYAEWRAALATFLGEGGEARLASAERISQSTDARVDVTDQAGGRYAGG